jgi:RsiW-degrading membrane proteinase PrsW (M82 family)
VVAAVIAYLWSRGSGDLAAIMRTDGDERQRSIDRDATAVAGLAMALTGIVGTIIALAHGNDAGDFAVVLMVGGFAYAIAVTVLRTRR